MLNPDGNWKVTTSRGNIYYVWSQNAADAVRNVRAHHLQRNEHIVSCTDGWKAERHTEKNPIISDTATRR